jgi:hypothetical protein
MFRLIQLYARHGRPRIGVDGDGYGSELAALARYRATPGDYFGVGRFDDHGQLQEIVVDTVCGPPGRCPRQAVAVHAETFALLCEGCSAGLSVLTVPQLAKRLGIAVRPTQVLAPATGAPGRHAAPEYASSSTNRIARELPARVGDPVWRRKLCAELDRHPASVNGVLIGVGALTYGDVLDLYPQLCALGAGLPADVRDELVRAADRPLSPAGLAARRMGL